MENIAWKMYQGVLLTFHISIYSLRDEVYLLKARQYIFSAKHICFLLTQWCIIAVFPFILIFA